MKRENRAIYGKPLDNEDDKIRTFKKEFGELKDHCILVTGVNKQGFQIAPLGPGTPFPEELPHLLNTHGDRLRALLDKPVLLHLFWNKGDTEVIVSVMPVKDNGQPFKTFTLSFGRDILPRGSLLH